jgi:hypothetical protein
VSFIFERGVKLHCMLNPVTAGIVFVQRRLMPHWGLSCSGKKRQLADIGKLAEFHVKIMIKDNSIIAINVKIVQGLVEISLNMDASSTSTGSTIAQAFTDGISRSGSLDEANTIGEMSTLPVFCKPVNLSESEYTVVNSIVIRLPDGSERVMFIYAKDTYFYTYQSCG